MEKTVHDQFRLPAGADIGGIQLRVSDLQQAVHFYGELVGFRVIERSNGMATLAGAVDHNAVIRLTESPEAKPGSARSAGLYHVAFRYSGRRELATALRRVLEHRYPVGGAADHLVSDAIYLEDPDGNGVEMYCDHPRDSWPRRGDEIVMSTGPLDVEGLLAEASEANEGEGEGVRGRVEIGHVHLQVTDLARAERFYHGLLGLDVTQRTFPGALFLSAGGYHHHIGLNIWKTRAGTPADQNSLGMISFEIRTGDLASLELLRTRLGESRNPAVSTQNSPSSSPLEVFDPDHIEVRLSL